jgi:hypothetical protein
MEYGMDGGVGSQNSILFLTKICEKDISMKYGRTSFDTTISEHGYNGLMAKQQSLTHNFIIPKRKRLPFFLFRNFSKILALHICFVKSLLTYTAIMIWF